jgi:SAM-dependent methyltransferase
MTDEVLREVGDYYTGKLRQHGATPQGVDWKDGASQELRFRKLLQIVADDAGRPPAHFTLLDYGCGYGALYDFMQSRYQGFSYAGYDISRPMIDEARRRHSAPNVEWQTERGDSRYDYIVASGIFNVKQARDAAAWWSYVEGELAWMNAHADRGFAFNMLTAYSDPDRQRDDLYYAAPASVLNHCQRQFSRLVALLHDYPLYEFTMLVRAK